MVEQYLSEVRELVLRGGSSPELIEELRDRQKFCGENLKRRRRLEEILRRTVHEYRPGPGRDFWKDHLLYFGYLIAALRKTEKGDREKAEEYIEVAEDLRDRYRRPEGIRCFR